MKETIAGIGSIVLTFSFPQMQKQHYEERMASQQIFQKVLDDKRAEYLGEVARQREQFTEVLAKASCKFERDK